MKIEKAGDKLVNLLTTASLFKTQILLEKFQIASNQIGTRGSWLVDENTSSVLHCPHLTIIRLFLNAISASNPKFSAGKAKNRG